MVDRLHRGDVEPAAGIVRVAVTLGVCRGRSDEGDRTQEDGQHH